MIFRDGWALLFVPLVFVIFFYARLNRHEAGILFPSDAIIKQVKDSLKLKIIRKLVYLRLVCIALIIIAAARPMVTREAPIKKEGIAIVLAVDCSSTMLAEDLTLSLVERMRLPELTRAEEDRGSKRLSRIKTVLKVARDFIESRPNDLIGLVAFAAEAFVACPLTFDHEWLMQTLDQIKVGMIKDGTAIGSGILNSLNQLKDVKAKSKIIILLTDGINNFGSTPPSIAAKASRSLGVKIYTIGIVSGHQVPYPTKDSSGRLMYKNVTIDINEDVLKEIASLTGGKYFRASDMDSLKKSYKEIDSLEKAGLEEKSYDNYEDVFPTFLVPALILLLFEILAKNTFLRKIP